MLVRRQTDGCYFSLVLFAAWSFAVIGVRSWLTVESRLNRQHAKPFQFIQYRFGKLLNGCRIFRLASAECICTMNLIVIRNCYSNIIAFACTVLSSVASISHRIVIRRMLVLAGWRLNLFYVLHWYSRHTLIRARIDCNANWTWRLISDLAIRVHVYCFSHCEGVSAKLLNGFCWQFKSIAMIIIMVEHQWILLIRIFPWIFCSILMWFCI